MRTSQLWLFVVTGLGLLAGVFPVAAQTLEPGSVLRIVSALDALDLETQARAVVIGGELRLEHLRLSEETAPVALELERFEVVKPEARVIVHGHAGPYEIPFPKNAYFKGTVDGDPSSLAVLVAQETGGVHGFLAHAGEIFTLGRQWAPRHDSVEARVDAADLTGDARAADWQCGNEGLVTPPSLVDLFLSLEESIEPPRATTTKYEVEIIFDTDYEFWALFGNDTAATNYISTLAAGASAIYDRDINAQWMVKDVYLYNGGAGSDPWAQAGSTICGLFEVGNYWNANRPIGTVPRDLVHFLSGKSLGGGVAWLGVLCRNPFGCTNGPPPSCGGLPACTPALPDPSYGGGIAYSADIDGDYTGANHVWDIIVTTHEGGHNFDSRHSHCYGNYPNAADPVIDECFNGQSADPNCWGGTESLPTGGGSIMSYCHTLPGGNSNINLYLGRAGFYGTNSERVQNRTRAEVEANIACLDPVVACSVGSTDLALSGLVTVTVTHEACNSITYSNWTASATANVTARSPLIVLGPDVTIAGEFTAVNIVP